MPEYAVNAGETRALPYRLACLCDLRDKDGRLLLLKRAKAPNMGLVSPIGGKLDVATGESPARCAQREIEEESGIHVPIERLHLTGLISESSFEGRGHWLLFYYRVMGPVWVEPRDMPEGRLDWFRRDQIESLPIPDSDRNIIWPLVWEHEPKRPDGRPGFFAVHIECQGEKGEKLTWRVEQKTPPV
ncbi:MAG: NUDIX domain-containing protein [Phycisphaerales bacterium]